MESKYWTVDTTVGDIDVVYDYVEADEKSRT